MAKLGDQDAIARANNPVGRDFSEALARGLEIMTAFGWDRRGMTLSDVSRRVELPRATVRRSLLTMVQLGYAEEDGRIFRLTPQVLRLATAYLGSSSASSLLQPTCERLAAEYGETFSVAALDGEDAVMIAYATPRRMYMEGAGVGLRLPAHCSAVGRVLLAGLPDSKREHILANLKLQAVTPRTVTDLDQLRHILRGVAADGYAVAEEEAELGFRSLAVPLRRSGGQLSFALNTGMAVGRSSAEDMRQHFLQRLLQEAASLQQQLP